MNSRLADELTNLRRTALQAIAQREHLPSEAWRLDHALQQPTFAAAIDTMRSDIPWYVAGLARVKSWIRRASTATNRTAA